MWPNKNKSPKIKISQPDRRWVEAEFAKLVLYYGYPSKEKIQFDFSETFFKNTFLKNKIDIESLIDDFCYLSNTDTNKVSYEFVSDGSIRQIPYVIKGKPFEMEVLFLEDKNFHFIISKRIINNPSRLLFNFAYEFSRIQLKKKALLKEDAKSYFDTFIAGVFFGYGFFLSNSLTNVGRKLDGFFETKWNYNSRMPAPVMAYALALFSVMNDNVDPNWKQQLPNEIIKEYEKCLSFIQHNNSDLFDLNRLKSKKLSDKATKNAKQKDYQTAVILLKEALSLTSFGKYRALFTQNIGYYLLMQDKLEEAILYLLQSIEIFPSSEYANNNLAYAYILKGELKKAKIYLDKIANSKDEVIIAYRYRDLALFYIKNEEFDKADEYFNLAFDMDIEVDLLSYYYADFLLMKGEIDKALKYAKISESKGEFQAKKILKRINS